MAYTIIKNAPPLTSSGAVYPFADMEVGDAFDAPRDMGKAKSGGDRRQNVISTCARSYAKRRNPTARFTVRLLDENTVRCRREA